MDALGPTKTFAQLPSSYKQIWHQKRPKITALCAQAHAAVFTLRGALVREAASNHLSGGFIVLIFLCIGINSNFIPMEFKLNIAFQCYVYVSEALEERTFAL